jgi:uncharacterized damage-inducible protein DinB
MFQERIPIQMNELKRLFDDMYRANHQMWQCILQFREDQLTINLGYLNGSVRTQLVQMICSENLWVNFLWHGEVEYLREAGFSTLAQVRLEWDALEAEMRDYLSTLTPADLEHLVELDFLNLPTLTVSDILLRVINHATNYRTQILLDIQLLCSPMIP